MDDELCVIWSGEWGAYWRAKASGYTDDARLAAIYTRSRAQAAVAHCGPEKRIEIRAYSAEIAKFESADRIARARIAGLREALRMITLDDAQPLTIREDRKRLRAALENRIAAYEDGA